MLSPRSRCLGGWRARLFAARNRSSNHGLNVEIQDDFGNVLFVVRRHLGRIGLPPVDGVDVLRP